MHIFVMFMKSWKHLDTLWKPSTKNFLESLFYVIIQAYSTELCTYWIWMEDEVRIKLILLNLSVLLRLHHFRDVKLWMLIVCTFQYIIATSTIDSQQPCSSNKSTREQCLFNVYLKQHCGMPFSFFKCQRAKKQSKLCACPWVCKASLMLDFISISYLIMKWEYVWRMKYKGFVSVEFFSEIKKKF